MTAAPSRRRLDAPARSPVDGTPRAHSRLHLPRRNDGTHALTSALPSRAADRDLRTRRYVISQTVRLCCFLAAALLPLPMLARLALMAASIALPWAAVIAANAGPARIRQRVNVLPPQPADPGSAASTARSGESLLYRLRWRMSYALLQTYGPAELSRNDDPRQQMLTDRANHMKSVPADPALPCRPRPATAKAARSTPSS